MLACQGCGKDVDRRLCCPKCHDYGRESFFCSQECFRSNWPTHNKVHLILNNSETYTHSMNSKGTSIAMQHDESSKLENSGSYDYVSVYRRASSDLMGDQTTTTKTNNVDSELPLDSCLDSGLNLRCNKIDSLVNKNVDEQNKKGVANSHNVQKLSSNVKKDRFGAESSDFPNTMSIGTKAYLRVRYLFRQGSSCLIFKIKKVYYVIRYYNADLLLSKRQLLRIGIILLLCTCVVLILCNLFSKESRPLVHYENPGFGGPLRNEHVDDIGGFPFDKNVQQQDELLFNKKNRKKNYREVARSKRTYDTDSDNKTVLYAVSDHTAENQKKKSYDKKVASFAATASTVATTLAKSVDSPSDIIHDEQEHQEANKPQEKERGVVHMDFTPGLQVPGITDHKQETVGPATHDRQIVSFGAPHVNTVAAVAAVAAEADQSKQNETNKGVSGEAIPTTVNEKQQQEEQQQLQTKQNEGVNKRIDVLEKKIQELYKHVNRGGVV